VAFKSYGLRRDSLARDILLQLVSSQSVSDKLVDISTSQPDKLPTVSDYLTTYSIDLADRLLSKLAATAPKDDPKCTDDTIFNEVSAIVFDGDLEG